MLYLLIVTELLVHEKLSAVPADGTDLSQVMLSTRLLLLSIDSRVISKISPYNIDYLNVCSEDVRGRLKEAPALPSLLARS